MLKIVNELPEHRAPIGRLTVESFAASPLGHHGEAELIDAIREQADEMLSLVALDGDRVVGHILFSPAEIRSSRGRIGGMGLGPMSVLPSSQRHGIGSLLVREGLRRLEQSESAFTVVAGHTDFYSRFGFSAAQDIPITHGFAGMPQEILLIRLAARLDKSMLRGGQVSYHAAFGPQHASRY